MLTSYKRIMVHIFENNPVYHNYYYKNNKNFKLLLQTMTEDSKIGITETVNLPGSVNAILHVKIPLKATTSSISFIILIETSGIFD